MIVLGISGWKKSGKDTAADFLINNNGFKRIAFADPLKDQAAKTYGIDISCMYDQDKKELPIIDMMVVTEDAFSRNLLSFMYKEFRTGAGSIPKDLFIDNEGNFLEASTMMRLYWTSRAILIMEGSVKRSVDSSHWVVKASNMIKDLHIESGHDKFVIADLRYRSEIKQLEHQFGDKFVSLRINRFWRSDSVDPSERDLDGYPFHYQIENTSTLDNFYLAVGDLVKTYER